MDENKAHLSYSQVSTYLMCPLKYNLHYIEQIEPQFTPAPLAFGSAIHEAVAAFYQSVLEGDPISVSQMHDVYREIWAAQSKERVIKFFNGDSEASLFNKAQAMLEAFINSFDPSVQIVGIEEPFEVCLDDTIPPLIGWIDAVELSPNGTVTVVDLKTASKRYSDQHVQSNLQLTCYSLGAQSLGFNGETKFRLDVLLKTQKPELVRYETTRTDADRNRFIRLVKSVWQGIEKGVFYPKEDWQCGQCAYSDQCKLW